MKAIEPTVNSLDIILRLADTFPDEGVKRLFYGLEAKHFDIPRVTSLTLFVTEAICKIRKEKITFQEFLRVEFKKYATDRNDYPNTIQTMMRHLGSHLAPLKIVLGKFCTHRHPTLDECEKWGVTPKYVLDMSMLTGGACEGEVFGIDTYPEEVKTLIDSLIEMFNLVGETIKMAKQALLDDDMVRSNPYLSMNSFEAYGISYYKSNRNTINALRTTSFACDISSNPFHKAIQKASTPVVAVQDGFHNFTTETMDMYFLSWILEGFTQHDITDEELSAWPANREAMLKARIVIDHIDTLVPDGTDDQKFAIYVCMFCVWTGNSSTRATYKCFKSRYRGTHNLRSYNTINGYRGKVGPKSAMYTQFTQAIETLLNKPENKKLWSQNKG